MKIALGADHGGYSLKEIIKEHLSAQGVEISDCGTFDTASCHYPVYAEKVASAITSGDCQLGILVCGTGIGMSMAANKVKGIRAAAISDTFSAKMTRAHNDANILCLGERTVGPGLALMLVDAFVSTPFEGGRHSTRVDMICDIENR